MNGTFDDSPAGRLDRMQAERARAYLTRELELQLEEAQRLAQIGSFDFDPATDIARWSTEMHRTATATGSCARCT